MRINAHKQAQKKNFEGRNTMSTKKTLAQQIQEAQEEIRQRENRLKELQQKQKEHDRKARTHRLCERGGYLESILPDTLRLTKEQFQSFLDKTLLTDFARKTLAGLAAQNITADDSASAAPKGGATKQAGVPVAAGTGSHAGGA